MLETLRIKIRALVEDLNKTDFEVFTYTNSSIFTIAQENITITKVLKNSVELESGDYDFDSDTNKITINESLSSGDVIEVDFSCYDYSDSALNEYIRASLVWLSIFSYCPTDYELEAIDIQPTPDSETLDLIAIIASILIKPNYAQYSLPNLKVKYPKNLEKSEKIRRIVQSFKSGLGVITILEYN
jgi:hypothetical protein